MQNAKVVMTVHVTTAHPQGLARLHRHGASRQAQLEVIDVMSDLANFAIGHGSVYPRHGSVYPSKHQALQLAFWAAALPCKS